MRQRLSISIQTRLLLFIMFSGVFFVTISAHFRVDFIKYHFDDLFNKRTMSVVKLEEIKDIYSVNILDTFREIEKSNISFESGFEVINLAKDLIDRYWLDYKSSSLNSNNDFPYIEDFSKKFVINEDKDNIEYGLISKIEYKIEETNYILDDIYLLFKDNKRELALKMLNRKLNPMVHSLNIYLFQFIQFHLELAIYEKKNTDNIYSNSFIFINIITGCVVFISIVLSILILNRIKNLHENLESEVEEKTKELRSFNHKLEKKIRIEVRESREKDRIMFQQSRLAQMGEMIGNIAHQWRQPLNAITILIQSFETKNLKGKLTDEFIERQVREGLRLSKLMSDTIEDFKNFFKPNRVKEQFLLRESINNSISLITKFYEKERISIKIVGAGDIKIDGYKNEFCQVLLNLLSNAKDALANLENEKKQIWIIIKQKNNFVIVSILDNAGGIEPDISERIFEPYFTTKHKSIGTGLGLYLSKQIIERQMGGKIIFKNIKHKFRTEKFFKSAMFQIELPIKEEE